MAEITSSSLTSSVAPTKEGETYAIVVTPESTDAPGFATLAIEVALAKTTQMLRAYAQIKQAAQ